MGIEKNVVLTRARHITASDGTIPHAAGAFSEIGQPLVQFRLFRYKSATALGEFENPTVTVTDSAVYGGYWFQHFGHFLCESLGRVYHLSKNQNEMIVFHTLWPKILSWQEDILGLLSIDLARVRFVTEPTLFTNLRFEEPGFVIGGRAEKAWADSLGVFETSREPERKIWLSRRNQAKGSVSNESELETILSDSGWEILCPEDHSITDQLSILASAKVLAGLEGSAFHSLLLLKRVSGKVVIVKRGSGLGNINRNYESIARIRELDQLVLNGFVEESDGLRSARFHSISALCERLQEF